MRREDPAGMGVYALARRASAIASKTADGDGWRVELEEKHFRGEEPATIEPCEMPKPGTAVTLTLQPEEAETMVREQVERAGRYHPLPIRFNGNPIEREDFLARATHTLEWEGLRIGVFRESSRAERGLNFHGVRIQLRDWPRVATGDGSWTACADVVDAPKLELTLPARHDVVRTISPSRCTGGCTRRLRDARDDTTTPAPGVRNLARGPRAGSAATSPAPSAYSSARTPIRRPPASTAIGTGARAGRSDGSALNPDRTHKATT